MPPVDIVIKGTLHTVGGDSPPERPTPPGAPVHPWYPPFGGGQPILIPGLPLPTPPIFIGPGEDRPSQLPVIRPDRPSNPIALPRPPRPDAGLPSAPVRPDQGLPGVPPHVSTGPVPVPGHPDQGLPPAPVRPDQGLPPSPGHPDAGLPEHERSYLLVWSPIYGWCYVELGAATPIGGSTLPEPPPTAQPK